MAVDCNFVLFSLSWFIFPLLASLHQGVYDSRVRKNAPAPLYTRTGEESDPVTVTSSGGSDSPANVVAACTSVGAVNGEALGVSKQEERVEKKLLQKLEEKKKLEEEGEEEEEEGEQEGGVARLQRLADKPPPRLLPSLPGTPPHVAGRMQNDLTRGEQFPALARSSGHIVGSSQLVSIDYSRRNKIGSSRGRLTRVYLLCSRCPLPK